MSILKAALNRENVTRDHKNATTEDRKGERVAVVAAIHKAFNPEVPELEKLSLRGDYGVPIAVSDAQAAKVVLARRTERQEQFGTQYCTTHGLELHLGQKISPEYLSLSVEERTDLAPLRVTLSIVRNFPFNSEVLTTFHGHTEPSEMLEKFFEALAKYVADVKAA